MPSGFDHNFAYLGDVGIWDGWMEQIAHRIDEDFPGTLPSQRFLHFVLNKSKVEALFIRMSGHTSESFRECRGIAMLAAG
jgi:hypothetical protein